MGWMRASVCLLGLLLASCGSTGGSPHSDGSGARDLSAARDLAGADLAALPDAAQPVDSAVPVDLAAPRDAAAPSDQSVPSDLGTLEDLSAGQCNCTKMCLMGCFAACCLEDVLQGTCTPDPNCLGLGG